MKRTNGRDVNIVFARNGELIEVFPYAPLRPGLRREHV